MLPLVFILVNFKHLDDCRKRLRTGILISKFNAVTGCNPLILRRLTA